MLMNLPNYTDRRNKSNATNATQSCRTTQCHVDSGKFRFIHEVHLAVEAWLLGVFVLRGLLQINHQHAQTAVISNQVPAIFGEALHGKVHLDASLALQHRGALLLAHLDHLVLDGHAQQHPRRFKLLLGANLLRQALLVQPLLVHALELLGTKKGEEFLTIVVVHGVRPTELHHQVVLVAVDRHVKSEVTGILRAHSTGQKDGNKLVNQVFEVGVGRLENRWTSTGTDNRTLGGGRRHARTRKRGNRSGNCSLLDRDNGRRINHFDIISLLDFFHRVIHRLFSSSLVVIVVIAVQAVATIFVIFEERRRRRDKKIDVLEAAIDKRLTNNTRRDSRKPLARVMSIITACVEAKLGLQATQATREGVFLVLAELRVALLDQGRHGSWRQLTSTEQASQEPAIRRICLPSLVSVGPLAVDRLTRRLSHGQM